MEEAAVGIDSSDSSCSKNVGGKSAKLPKTGNEVSICSDEDVIQIESSLLTEEIVYDDFTNALNTPNSQWWMTVDKQPVSIESCKKMADCDSVIGDSTMMDIDSFLNLTSSDKDKSEDNEHITLIVDSDSGFSLNDAESGLEDDGNILCEISQKCRGGKNDAGSKCSSNSSSAGSSSESVNSDSTSNKNSEDDDDEFVDKRKRRHRNPDGWKINIQKNARLRGLEYIGIGGRKVPAREMGPPCTCRLHCSVKISESNRKLLHSRFWQDHNWEQRKQLIADCVRETTRNSRKYSPEGRNPIAYTYFLTTPGPLYVSVCKIMFLSTFAISEKFVRCVLEKKKKSPYGIIGPDLRGKHHTTKKSEEVRQRIRDHVKSFPTVKDETTGKQYLDSRHTISGMYKMYVEQCRWKKVPAKDVVKESYYREIFKNEFNYGFRDFTEATQLPDIPI